MTWARASQYDQRVADNVLPLSVAGVLGEALTEWRFIEEVVDHEEATETCGLCDHEGLRYHFQIENEHTDNQLWVGSRCILKFEVAVYDDGRRLSPAEAKKKLDVLTDKMRLASCLKALKQLASSDDHAILRSALAFYERNKYLTPKFANVVFWKLKEFRIDHTPSFFRVNLKFKKYRDDLEHMSTHRVRRFWEALTSSQREMAMKFGHSPPR